jgi:amidase
MENAALCTAVLPATVPLDGNQPQRHNVGNGGRTRCMESIPILRHHTHGQLGSDLVRCCGSRPVECTMVFCPDRADDIRPEDGGKGMVVRMNREGLVRMDAVGQAELVRTGACSPMELVDIAIDAIERINPSVNAFVSTSFDRAREAASSPELPEGPFRGVPFAFKDFLGQTAGDPYHAGMRLLRARSWTARSDSFLAADLRRAGLVFVGRTNVPELAGSVTTEPLAYGAARNPWNLDISPGGSSGGSGAAVAAGLVPAAHGNDMGGSIRIPASYCGLVGLKPSHGRSSLGPEFGEFWGTSTHEGVVTRTVRDTAALLDAMSVSHAGDPYVAPPPAAPFFDTMNADPGMLRIGVFTGVPGSQLHVDAAYIEATESVARLLEEMGHEVDSTWPIALNDQTIDELQYQVVAVGLARELQRWGTRLGIVITSDDVEPKSWQFAEVGRSLSATSYIAAVEGLQRHARRLCSWWTEGFDLLLTPTVNGPAARIGELAPLANAPASRGRDVTHFVRPWNITGQPAISLPLAWDDNAMPIGVQLVAAYGQEALLIQIAAALERALPWRDRIPPCHA